MRSQRSKCQSARNVTAVDGHDGNVTGCIAGGMMGIKHIEIIAGEQRKHPLLMVRSKGLPEVQQGLDMGSERAPVGRETLKMAR